jgi:hypothetical protein
MKIRNDREALLHLTAFPKLLVLGEKTPFYDEETKRQVENTDGVNCFPDGHMIILKTRS